MPQDVRILCLDGGGMRGIIAGEILTALERMLRQRTGNEATRLADHFDLVAGTSTGAIQACLLLCPSPARPERPRYTAEEAAQVLIEQGSHIFNLSLWQHIRSMGGLTNERYPAEPLEHTLAELLGETRISELLRPCLLTAYDIERRQAFFFTRERARRDPGRDFLARDAARASAAAPALFEVARIRALDGSERAMVDGGVFASNPSLCAYTEARKAPGRPGARNLRLLSLGPGRMASSYRYEVARHWGIIEWLKPLLDIFMSGVAETVDYQLRQLFAAEGAAGNYLRLDPHVGEDCTPELDNASAKNILALQAAGRQAVAADRERLERFVDLLIAPE